MTDKVVVLCVDPVHGGTVGQEIRDLSEIRGEGGGGGAHSHPQSEVTGLEDALAGKESAGAADAALAAARAADFSGSWNDLGDKPQTFPPSAHDHDAAYEAKNANIQQHIAAAHAPSNAQKNSDITKAEIEAKLAGEISSHTHAGGGGGPTIKSGVVNLGAGGSANVSFVTPFATTPRVLVTSQINNADTSSTISAHTVTANGFVLRGAGNPAGNVAWLATDAGNA